MRSLKITIFIYSLIFAITGCTRYETRNGSPKLTWIDSSVLINAPIDKVWKVVAEDFSDNQKHMLGVKKSYYIKKNKNFIGSIRRSEHGGEEYIDVKITHWNKNRKYVQWIIVEENVPLLSEGVGSYQLKYVNESTTKLTQMGGYRMKPQFLDGLAKGRIKSMFKDILLGIKYQIETGNSFSKDAKKEVFNDYVNSIEI